MARQFYHACLVLLITMVLSTGLGVLQELLRVTDHHAEAFVTVDEYSGSCPNVEKDINASAPAMLGVGAAWGPKLSGFGAAPSPGAPGKQTSWPVMRTFLRSVGTGFTLLDKISTRYMDKELLIDNWSDAYTAALYLAFVRGTMGMYSARDRSFVNVPIRMADTATQSAADLDVDGYPNFLLLERDMPQPLLQGLYVPALTGLCDGIRELEFEDHVNDTSFNTWDVVLQSGKYKNKKAWLLSFYDNAKTLTNDPTWPVERMDFTGMFRKADDWDDGLEKALAFDAIGVHHVVSVSREFAGEILPFAIKLNAYSKFDVRKNFGKYGCDMYFTAEGLPALIETPEGRLVQRGDKDWQYWKFVWRSSLLTVITLVDHLHFAHLKVAGGLAHVVRSALGPKHPARRTLSIFTFGSIFINMMAERTLVGEYSVLDRATPFENFGPISKAVPEMLPDISRMYGLRVLNDDALFNQLPPRLAQAPFYADGKLLMDSFKRFSAASLDAAGEQWCQDGKITDPDLKRMLHRLLDDTPEAQHQAVTEDPSRSLCGLLVERLALYMFVVTAWHSHVGFVGDYYSDPDLAVTSWVDGERSGRPRQAVIASIINAFTSTKQPLLMDDYSHMFEGIVAEDSLQKVWNEFGEDLRQIKVVIDERNKARPIPNINMDPAVLESSISK